MTTISKVINKKKILIFVILFFQCCIFSILTIYLITLFNSEEKPIQIVSSTSKVSIQSAILTTSSITTVNSEIVYLDKNIKFQKKSYDRISVDIPEKWVLKVDYESLNVPRQINITDATDRYVYNVLPKIDQDKDNNFRFLIYKDTSENIAYLYKGVLKSSKTDPGCIKDDQRTIADLVFCKTDVITANLSSLYIQAIDDRQNCFYMGINNHGLLNQKNEIFRNTVGNFIEYCQITDKNGDIVYMSNYLYNYSMKSMTYKFPNNEAMIKYKCEAIPGAALYVNRQFDDCIIILDKIRLTLK